jgi:hypothetical protein
VDSPSFTPLQTAPNGSVTPSARNAAISPKAASAAVFTPKSQRSSEFLRVAVIASRLHADCFSREHPEPAQQGACYRLARARVSGICTRDVWGSDGVYTSLFSLPLISLSPILGISLSTSSSGLLSSFRSIPMLQHHIQALTRTRQTRVYLRLLDRLTKHQP